MGEKAYRVVIHFDGVVEYQVPANTIAEAQQTALRWAHEDEFTKPVVAYIEEQQGL